MDAQFNRLNSDLNQNLKQFYDSVRCLNDKLKSGEFDFKNGNSFLDLKNHTILQYLNNLVYFMLLKINGEKIENQKCILRLAELRCVLDKMKPIEAKLKYQIDKLLKFADGSLENFENDPLHLKPNINDFANNKNDAASGDDDEEEGSEDDDDEDEEHNKKSSKLYRPPKLAAMYNDIDETAKDKLNKRIDKAKRHALNSSLMRDLHMQYSDAPEEITNNNINIIENDNKEMKHRQEYEEDNFIRKPLTKQEMARAKRMQNGTNLSKLSSFDDAKVLFDTEMNMEDYVQKKGKRKAVAGKKGSKKNKKKKIRYT